MHHKLLFNKTCYCLTRTCSTFFPSGMPSAVLQSRGVHLPGLQARPGQELLHVGQQIPARHSKSVFPRVQQRAVIIGATYSALEEMRRKLYGPFSVEAIKNQFSFNIFYDYKTAIFVDFNNIITLDLQWCGVKR